MREDIIRRRENEFGCEFLVKTERANRYRDLLAERPTLEDIMLFYVKGELV